jgi:hypothetical protein
MKIRTLVSQVKQEQRRFVSKGTTSIKLLHPPHSTFSTLSNQPPQHLNTLSPAFTSPHPSIHTLHVPKEHTKPPVIQITPVPINPPKNLN